MINNTSIQFSIIIPVFNNEQTIERAIQSCLSQTLQSFELIIINDGSIDNSKAIINAYSNYKNITILHNTYNMGVSYSRNRGIAMAKGEYICFLDADDYLHSESLRVQNLFLNENNALDAVAIDYYLVNERGQHLQHVASSEKPIACGIMFRKDHLYNIGLYDETFAAREEEDLRIRWENAGFGIYHIPLPLYRYRMHDGNMTKDNERMLNSQEQLNAKHKL